MHDPPGATFWDLTLFADRSKFERRSTWLRLTCHWSDAGSSWPGLVSANCLKMNDPDCWTKACIGRSYLMQQLVHLHRHRYLSSLCQLASDFAGELLFVRWVARFLPPLQRAAKAKGYSATRRKATGHATAQHHPIAWSDSDRLARYFAYHLRSFHACLWCA